MATDKTVSDFLAGKSDITKTLYHHFINEFMKVGMITVYPAKTMVGVSNGTKRIAWVTELGKDFVHVIFPFTKPFEDNFCFTKIAQVPGTAKQFNHHFRIYFSDDINDEVKQYMKLAFDAEE